jgi:hypothetical protein
MPEMNEITNQGLRPYQREIAEAVLSSVYEKKGLTFTVEIARAIFLSADNGANVVGNTAHLLLEVDEAQDVDEEL